jgi:antitoxin PrlF
MHGGHPALETRITIPLFGKKGTTDMETTLTSKGQVTIPKHVRDALALAPGDKLEFSIGANGDLVLKPVPPPKPARGKQAARKQPINRFEAMRGTATIKYASTDELMKLLRDPIV